MIFSNKDLRTAPTIARLDVPVSVLLLNVTLAQRGVLRHHVREAGLLHDAPAVGAIAGPGSDHVQHLQRHEVQMNAEVDHQENGSIRPENDQRGFVPPRVGKADPAPDQEGQEQYPREQICEEDIGRRKRLDRRADGGNAVAVDEESGEDG